HVTRLTKQIADDGVNVRSDPIYLTVYKHDIPDLTLIDLPGITRNPLQGQSTNIHTQILNSIRKYIEPKTAIVLHVIPASVDFSASESMKEAKIFDPHCRRQLIAASKIDKFDKGISDKLQGTGPDSMELALGCVAVLNRSQDEIDQRISFDEMKCREKQFFINHPEAFQNLPPDIIDGLKQRIRLKKHELKQLPPSVTSELECWTKFNELINKFRESIQQRVNGNYENETMKMIMTKSANEIFDSDDKSSEISIG
ncbi:unnamed protein product, partial [Didymodactylos carnosus]